MGVNSVLYRTSSIVLVLLARVRYFLPLTIQSLLHFEKQLLTPTNNMIAANVLLDRSTWSYRTPKMASRLSCTISTAVPPNKKMRRLLFSPPEAQPDDDKIGVILPPLPDFGMTPCKRSHLAPRMRLRTCSITPTRSPNNRRIVSGKS
jgi:hypothetical protein